MHQNQQTPSKLKKFLKETRRVIHILKKPDREEFTNLVKVTGLGIAIIGVVGFILFLLKQLLL